MEVLNTETEIKKIKHVFKYIKNDLRKKSGIQVIFYHFEDVNDFRDGDAIANFMTDQLVKDCFQKIVLFAALIKNDEVSYRLSIVGEPGENDGPIVTIDCFLKDVQEISGEFHVPQISKEISLQTVRTVLWNAYKFFGWYGVHTDLEADIIKTFQ